MRITTLAIAAAISAGALAFAFAAESGQPATIAVAQNDAAAPSATDEQPVAVSDEGAADVSRRKVLTTQDFGENEGSENGTGSEENESASQYDD